VFQQLALQGTPMHTKKPRSLADIAILLRQHPLNMLPFHLIGRQ
jgi:hypothetical protein